MHIISQLEDLKEYATETTTEIVRKENWVQKSVAPKKAKLKPLKTRIREHAKELEISDYNRNKLLKSVPDGVPIATAWVKYAKEYCKKKKIKYVDFESVALPKPAEMAAMIKRINAWCKKQGYKGIRKKKFTDLWKDNGSEAAIRRAIAKENK